MKRFEDHKFDKILLVGVFTLLFAGSVWGAYIMSEPLSNWAREQAAFILGAVVALTTGKVMGRGNSDESKSGSDSKSKGE